MASPVLVDTERSATNAFETIINRARHVPPHAPRHLLAFNQLASFPQALRKKLNDARLEVFGQNKRGVNALYLRFLQNAALSYKLSQSQRKLNDYQRLLEMLASNDVKRLECVSGAAMKRGCSVTAIIVRVDQAVNGLYTA